MDRYLEKAHELYGEGRISEILSLGEDSVKIIRNSRWFGKEPYENFKDELVEFKELMVTSYLLMGRTPEAEQEFAQLFRIDPRNYEPQINEWVTPEFLYLYSTFDTDAKLGWFFIIRKRKEFR